MDVPFGSDGLQRLHQVDEARALEFWSPLQVDGGGKQDGLDLLWAPDELRAHRYESGDRGGDVRRGHARAAVLLVNGVASASAGLARHNSLAGRHQVRFVAAVGGRPFAEK